MCELGLNVHVFPMLIASCFNHICWKDCFTHWIALVSHWKSNHHVVLNVVLSFSSLFCAIMCLYTTILSWWLAFWQALKLGSIRPPTWSFFVKIALDSLGLLHFHTNFRTSLSISTNKACWKLGLRCVESIDQIGENWYLNNIESSHTGAFT